MRPCAGFLLVAALSFSAPVSAGPGDPGVCPAPDFVSGTQRAVAPPESWVAVSFSVAATLTGTFWGEMGYHANAAGFATERTFVAFFIETAAGDPVGSPGALAGHPYGAQVSAGETTLRATQLDSVCGAHAAGSDFTLAPGDYRMIVLGTSDTRADETAALLPRGVRITGSATGPVSRISEVEMTCQLKLAAYASGFSSYSLAGCAQSLSASSRAYRALFVSHVPDAAHVVRWTTPSGGTIEPVVFDLGRGEPGTWTLSVPRYLTPVGQPIFVPGVGADSGIIGAFADVQ